jgi:hypothetical protein
VNSPAAYITPCTSPDTVKPVPALLRAVFLTPETTTITVNRDSSANSNYIAIRANNSKFLIGDIKADW